jgi:hypothetical protein
MERSFQIITYVREGVCFFRELLTDLLIYNTCSSRHCCKFIIIFTVQFLP